MADPQLAYLRALTGEKTDDWLVKTVGAMITVTALVMLLAGWRGTLSPEVVLLSAGSAAALLIVDIVYVERRVILPVYLLDAGLEVLTLLAWAAAWLTRS